MPELREMLCGSKAGARGLTGEEMVLKKRGRLLQKKRVEEENPGKFRNIRGVSNLLEPLRGTCPFA